MRERHSALVLTALLTATGAVASTGVRNAGSGHACAGAPTLTAESLVALRGTLIHEISDRETFIRGILARIPSEDYRRILRARWDAYGDSENWPVGDPSEFEIDYYVAPTVAIPYGGEGRIPATDPGAPSCASPQYDPDLCCDRVLLSFFGPKSSRPHRVAAAYEKLSRHERNVLELHETVFRSARELARLQIDAPRISVTEDEIREYRRWRDYTGEIPSAVVVTFASTLLRADLGPESVRDAFERLWSWSAEIYGARPDTL